MLQRYVYRHSKRISQRADTTAEEERLIVNPTIFAVSQNLFSKIMSKYFIQQIHIQELLLAFILLSYWYECLIFSLGSNESEAEEDKVEKRPKKKRKGQQKAPAKSKVGLSIMSSDCNNWICVVRPMFKDGVWWCSWNERSHEDTLHQGFQVPHLFQSEITCLIPTLLSE